MWTLWNKIYLIKTVFKNSIKWGLKGGISIDTDSGPVGYVLWCCGSKSQDFLLLFRLTLAILWVEISQNFVAFSEYMNFIWLEQQWLSKQRPRTNVNYNFTNYIKGTVCPVFCPLHSALKPVTMLSLVSVAKWRKGNFSRKSCGRAVGRYENLGWGASNILVGIICPSWLDRLLICLNLGGVGGHGLPAQPPRIRQPWCGAKKLARINIPFFNAI